MRAAQDTLRGAWDYVNGPAVRAETPNGVRDAENDGKTPEQFRGRINDHIRERRALQRPEERHTNCVEPRAASPRSRAPLQRHPSRSRLPEAHAFPTRDEVLAGRLYSGPCFEPINDWLRQIGRLSGDTRLQFALHAGTTFIA